MRFGRSKREGVSRPTLRHPPRHAVPAARVTRQKQFLLAATEALHARPEVSGNFLAAHLDTHKRREKQAQNGGVTCTASQVYVYLVAQCKAVQRGVGWPKFDIRQAVSDIQARCNSATLILFPLHARNVYGNRNQHNRKASVLAGGSGRNARLHIATPGWPCGQRSDHPDAIRAARAVFQEVSRILRGAEHGGIITTQPAIRQSGA